MSEVDCTVVTPVQADRLYQPGETIRLDAREAESLEKAGAVSLDGDPGDESGKPFPLLAHIRNLHPSSLSGLLGDIMDLAVVEHELPVGDLFPVMIDQLDNLGLVDLMGLVARHATSRGLTPEDLLALAETINPTPEAEKAAGGASQEAPGGDPEKDPPPSRFDFIVAQCQNVDPANPDHKFTADGRPHVATLEAVTGLTDITADERTDAWEAFKARERD